MANTNSPVLLTEINVYYVSISFWAPSQGNWAPFTWLVAYLQLSVRLLDHSTLCVCLAHHCDPAPSRKPSM
jgi:hypothetical protein